MVSLLPGGSLGRYQIIELIGRGGMAAVFRAYDPVLNRHVAVKVLLPSHQAEDPTFLARFTQEAQAAARLNHPNILKVYDFGEDKGFTYLVTELLTGGTLQDRLGEPLTLEETLRYLRPLADALDYAHAQRVVHRDIKPTNVLLDEDDRPVLADFGLARLMEVTSRMTAEQMVLGTAEYMAPEQALGRDADYRADLYSLGILAYQMLLGETPFHGDTPAATLMAHVHQPLPLPRERNPDLDPRVEVVLLKATAKDPNDRYRSAREMVEALAGAGGAGPELGPRPDAPPTAVLPTMPVEAPEMEPPAEAKPQEAAPRTGRLPRAAVIAVRALIATVLGGLVGLAIGLAVTRDGGDGEPAAAATRPPAGAAAPPPVAAAQPTATPSPTPTRLPTATPPPTATPISVAEALVRLERTFAAAGSRVEALRGLKAQEPINPNYRPREHLRVLAEAMFKRDLKDTAFELEELYKALGLMDESQDLQQTVVDILVQQVYALFDPETESLYVLSDSPEIGPLEELAIVSVYMAGLQQQHFDIASLRRQAQEAGDLDRLRAVTAFLGGDVAQVQQIYMRNFMTPQDLAELQKPLPDNKLAAAPEVIRRTVLFPQREGADFVFQVFAGGDGWDSVNAVYDRPPVSTEQILHPDKYLSGEVPRNPDLPEVAEAMGKGWREIGRNTLGELLLQTYLAAYLEPDDAAEAAAGWGGDRYVLLTGPEAERLLILAINWDRPEDGPQFFESYRRFMDAKTGGQAAVSVQGGAMWWLAEDGATVLRQLEGGATLLVLGDKDTDVARALEAVLAGLSPASG